MKQTRPSKVNLDDVPANRKRGGDIRLTLSPGTVGCTSGFGGVLHLGVGEVVTEHFHPYSEEFVHVITGELELVRDGERVRLGPGDSAFVPIGVRHRLLNVGGARATAVFHLAPLAPHPSLGHVDTEEPVVPSAPNPNIGQA